MIRLEPIHVPFQVRWFFDGTIVCYTKWHIPIVIISFISLLALFLLIIFTAASVYFKTLRKKVWLPILWCVIVFLLCSMWNLSSLRSSLLSSLVAWRKSTNGGLLWNLATDTYLWPQQSWIQPMWCVSSVASYSYLVVMVTSGAIVYPLANRDSSEYPCSHASRMHRIIGWLPPV